MLIAPVPICQPNNHFAERRLYQNLHFIILPETVHHQALSGRQRRHDGYCG